MSANRVYDICLQRIRQLRPQERITRLRNFARIVAEIRSGRSVHLSHIAEKIPGDAKSVSKLEVRLLTDGTKVGFGHQLLMVGLAYRKRAIPIAWTWVNSARGHSSATKQGALLTYMP